MTELMVEDAEKTMRHGAFGKCRINKPTIKKIAQMENICKPQNWDNKA